MCWSDGGELVTVACRCALRLCTIEAHMSVAVPPANESSSFYGPKRTRLLGLESRLRGWLIPVLCNHGSPASRLTPGRRGHFPAVGLPPLPL